MATATLIINRADSQVRAGGRIEFVVEVVEVCGGIHFIQWPGTGGVGKGPICTSSHDVGSQWGDAVQICRTCGAWATTCADNCSRIARDVRMGRLV